VSLLLANGHGDARFYPIYRLWEEANIIIERLNAQLGSEATLIQLAIGAAIDKKAGKQFQKTIKRLMGY
jgi:hypothetical protein